jgi:hypothetical protein
MQQFRGIAVVFALLVVSAAVCHAVDDTTVSEDDVKSLIPLDGHAGRVQSWRGGIIFRVVSGPWLTASWEKPEAQPLLPIAGAKVLDVCRNRTGHFVRVRSVGETAVFLLKEDGSQEKVALPDTLAESSDVGFIPCNTGLALGLDDVVWWQKDRTWKTTQVTPCPSMLRGNGHPMPVAPLGDVQFIKNGFLYAGSQGGEFGGAFAWYDLSQSKGSWGVIWRERWSMSPQRVFLDSKGNLYAFNHLHHRFTYQYQLMRGFSSRWESLISNDVSTAEFPMVRKREGRDTLQSDSFVSDAAPMPDGRIALLSEDEGVYVKGNGFCPCLFHFNFAREGWCDGPRLCFDDAGNAYVDAPSQGLLVFHRDPSGPWRVKQIKIP